MRKSLFLVLALFMATSMSAQFYAGLGLGYGMGANKDQLGTEVSGTTQTQLYASFGAGLNVNLKLGYNLSDNLGVEMGVSYLLGSKVTNLDNTPTLVESKASGLRLAPQLVYRLENGMYSRFGVIIPAMGKIVTTVTSTNYEQVTETKGSFTTGFIGAIGYSYQLSDNMDFFAELEYIGLSIKSKSDKITKEEANGNNLLDGATTNYLETEYVDEMDSSATPPTADEPDQQMATKVPFSSLGINVGIVMKF